jgi:hypothetical protein
MSTETRDIRPIYVSVQMHNGSRYRGNVYLPSNQRLQDLLNDTRSFIPIEQSFPNGTVTIVAKHFIVSIEESREHETVSQLGKLNLI